MLAALVPAPAEASLETVVQDDGALLHSPAATVAPAARQIAAMGVNRVRLTASWSSLTRDSAAATKPDFDARDPAAYEQARWRQLDRAVRAVRATGMKVLVDIGFWAPHWAASDPPGPRARTNIDPAAYADFATAVARRYSGAFNPPVPAPAQAAPAPSDDAQLLDAILAPPPFAPSPFSARASAANDTTAIAAADALPRVDQFVLWNEPNIPAFILPQWDGPGTNARPVSPGRYRAMVQAAYPAIKAVRRDAKVLIGNTSSTGGARGSGAVAPLEFLRELACVDADLVPLATPACTAFTKVPGDGFAHHPYVQNERPSRPSSPETEPGDVRIADLPQLAATLDELVKAGRLARRNRDIYITEFGYETHAILGRPIISQATHARWLTWAEYLADAVPTVRSFAQYLLRDQGPAKRRVTTSEARAFGQFYTGLLEADGSEKIAASTFRAGLFAERRSKRRALLYVRLRLGAGPRDIGLERRLGSGPWRQLARVTADGRSAFTRTVGYRSGARYRITYPRGDTRAAGLAVAAQAPPLPAAPPATPATPER